MVWQNESERTGIDGVRGVDDIDAGLSMGSVFETDVVVVGSTDLELGEEMNSWILWLTVAFVIADVIVLVLMIGVIRGMVWNLDRFLYEQRTSGVKSPNEERRKDRTMWDNE